MKKLISALFLALTLVVLSGFSQSSDTSFFPFFQAYSTEPIINCGDGFPHATWNDPCVIKQNGQYIMYTTAATDITGADHVKLYRMVSNDGYNWTLSPTTPLIEPVPQTYYAGGLETPSVVYFNGQYHIYFTVFPAGNVAQDYAVGHGISPDGITWQMDSLPVLISDGSASWMGDVVGEPGALIYHDSIYLFFQALGLQNTDYVQSIGLMRSSDGTNFGSAMQMVTKPNDVYPSADNWFGLSTPSAIAINDTIYLFTDVARIVNGTWTQAALHQFKSYGNLNKWYYSSSPIHEMQDFEWTNGEYLSEIRAINALMDDNGLLRIWYAGNRLADISGTDTTYHVIIDSTGIHADPDYWGIGTSEYQFANGSTGINALLTKPEINIYPNPATDYIYIQGAENEEFYIVNCLGEIVVKKLKSNNRVNVSKLVNGTYSIISSQNHSHHRFMVMH